MLFMKHSCRNSATRQNTPRPMFNEKFKFSFHDIKMKKLASMVSSEKLNNIMHLDISADAVPICLIFDWEVTIVSPIRNFE